MANPYHEAIAAAFVDELQKIAAAKTKIPYKTLGLVGAGAVGYEALRRANQDRRMGRAMRIQQGSY